MSLYYLMYHDSVGYKTTSRVYRDTAVHILGYQDLGSACGKYISVHGFSLLKLTKEQKDKRKVVVRLMK